MSEFKPLPPFKFWCQKVIPLVYDESLSYYELLCKVIDYLNHTMEDVNTLNEAFTQLKAYVENFFETEEFQKELEKKLDEMAEDGTLESLLANVLSYPVFPVVVQRTGRLLDSYEKEDRSKILFAQGCYYANGTYYVCGANSDNSRQVVSKWGETGVLLESESYTELGHANDICYLNNYIYIANAAGMGTITVINNDDLTIDRYITFGQLGSIYAIGTYNEKIYFLSYETENPDIKKLYYVTPGEETELFEVCALPELSGASAQGGLIIKDNMLYIAYALKNSVFKISLETGLLVSAYNIAPDDSFFPVGELECIFEKDNDIYIFSHNHVLWGVSIESGIGEDFANFFRTSILEYNGYAFPTELNKESEAHRTILTCNGNATYEFNPKLTFTTLRECAILLNYHKGGTLNMQAISNGFLYLADGNYTIRGVSGTRIIKRLNAYNVTLIVSQCTIDDLVLTGCNATFKACTFTNKIDIEYSKVLFNYAIMANLQRTRFQRSDIEYHYIKSYNKNIIFDTGEAESNSVTVKSAYAEGIIYIPRVMLGTTDTNTEMVIQISLTDNNVIFDRLSGKALADSRTTPVVHNLKNSEWAQITYDNGKIGISANVGDPYTALTAAAFVQFSAMPR